MYKVFISRRFLFIIQLNLHTRTWPVRLIVQTTLRLINRAIQNNIKYEKQNMRSSLHARKKNSIARK